MQANFWCACRLLNITLRRLAFKGGFLSTSFAILSVWGVKSVNWLLVWEPCRSLNCILTIKRYASVSITLYTYLKPSFFPSGCQGFLLLNQKLKYQLGKSVNVYTRISLWKMNAGLFSSSLHLFRLSLKSKCLGYFRLPNVIELCVHVFYALIRTSKWWGSSSNFPNDRKYCYICIYMFL